jgi:hypothetical protein
LLASVALGACRDEDERLRDLLQDWHLVVAQHHDTCPRMARALDLWWQQHQRELEALVDAAQTRHATASPDQRQRARQKLAIEVSLATQAGWQKCSGDPAVYPHLLRMQQTLERLDE